MFGFIADFFNFFLYLPLFNILIAIYDYVPGHDFGVAIILLTVLIRLVLYPVAVKALHSQRAIQKLQPHIQELQLKHKDDKEKQAKETLELYRKEGINPLSGLFLALVQLPILIALYQVFWKGLKVEQLANLYSFIPNPGSINVLFLQTLDLSKPSIALALVAAVVQFFQGKMLMPPTLPSSGDKKSPTADIGVMMQKQMIYFFPFVTAIILFRLPSALGLYWIVSGLFSIGQQYLVIRKSHKTNL